MLTNHQRDLVTFTWGQFHGKCSRCLSFGMSLKMTNFRYCSQISRVPNELIKIWWKECFVVITYYSNHSMLQFFEVISSFELGHQTKISHKILILMGKSGISMLCTSGYHNNSLNRTLTLNVCHWNWIVFRLWCGIFGRHWEVAYVHPLVNGTWFWWGPHVGPVCLILSGLWAHFNRKTVLICISISNINVKKNN